MSLITRCPACGTHFRVVPDQLRVSDGWVRCGQCEEVFDGQAHLQTPAPVESFSDTVSAPLPEAPDKAATSEINADAGVADSGNDKPLAADNDITAPVDDDILALAAATQTSDSGYEWGDMVANPSATDAHGSAVDVAQTPNESPVAGEELHSGRDVGSTEPELVKAPQPALSAHADDAPLADPLLDKSPNELAAAASASPPDDWSVSPLEELSGFDESVLPESLRYVQADGPLPEPVDVPRPTFLERQNPSRRRWMHSRRLMGTLAMLLGVSLLVQVVVQERDRLAASVPAMEPALHVMCEWVGCQVLAPRNIAAIAIESSSFAKVRTDVFRLSFSLRNTGTMPLAVPAVELTLSDSQDQVLLRKVLLPQDFAGKKNTLGPNGELSASLPVQVRPGTQAERVVSYVVLGFYP